MKTGANYHLSHNNVKFELRKYISLSKDKHTFEFCANDFSATVTLEKTTPLSWKQITQRSYFKKELRFTHRNDGREGLWVVVRFPRQLLAKHIKNGNALSCTRTFDGFSYSIAISCSVDVLAEISQRSSERAVQAKKRSQNSANENNTKTAYVCHNPRPLQGGGFSPK